MPFHLQNTCLTFFLNECAISMGCYYLRNYTEKGKIDEHEQ